MEVVACTKWTLSFLGPSSTPYFTSSLPTMIVTRNAHTSPTHCFGEPSALIAALPKGRDPPLTRRGCASMLWMIHGHTAQMIHGAGI